MNTRDLDDLFKLTRQRDWEISPPFKAPVLEAFLCHPSALSSFPQLSIRSSGTAHGALRAECSRAALLSDGKALGPMLSTNRATAHQPFCLLLLLSEDVGKHSLLLSGMGLMAAQVNSGGGGGTAESNPPQMATMWELSVLEQLIYDSQPTDR